MIGPAVVVVVGHDRRHRIGLRGRSDARGLADVGEGAVAVVVEQLHVAGRQAARAAVDRDALPSAVAALARLGEPLQRRVEIGGDEEIEAAVAIVVDPGAAGAVAHGGLREPGLRGHVGEGAVAVVVVQHVVPVGGDEQVVEAVVVVVADRHRRRPAGARQPRLRRDVGERAVAVVLVEAIRGFGRRVLEAGAAQHQDVHPAVVVVVEEGDAAPDDLDDVALRVDAAVDARLRQPGFLRDVGEAGIEGAAGRLAPRLRLDRARRHPLREGTRRWGREQRREQGAPGDHRTAFSVGPLGVAGSVATSVRPAATSVNVCVAPDGQRISTRLATVSLPSPTTRRLSLADR